jgi:hypothetical protein
MLIGSNVKMITYFLSDTRQRKHGVLPPVSLNTSAKYDASLHGLQYIFSSLKIGTFIKLTLLENSANEKIMILHVQLTKMPHSHACLILLSSGLTDTCNRDRNINDISNIKWILFPILSQYPLLQPTYSVTLSTRSTNVFRKLKSFSE